MNFTKKNIGNWRGQMNIAYLKKLYLISRRDVIRVINPLVERGSHTLPVSGIATVPEPVVYEFDFAPKSAGMNIECNAGIYEVAISADIPRVSESHLIELIRNQGDEFVAMVVDGNDHMRIAGDEEQGLKMKVTESIQGKNYLGMTLAMRTDHQVWYGAADSLIGMMPDSAFSFGFSLGYRS